jgi:hypothetical protein
MSRREPALSRRIFVAVVLAITCALTAGAQNSSPDLRGIYIYTNDVSQITTATANQLTASFSIPGVDGVAVVIGWDAIEPSMGQYQWTVLDQWIGQVAALGKKIDLVVPAGSSTPTWLFQAAPTGAGATELNFTVSPHGGQTGVCDTVNIAAPWDPIFLAQWDSMLAALSAHLKNAGTYNAVTLVRITGINRTTEELRLPAETAASTGLACVSNSLTTWQQAGYRPSLLLQGWNTVVGSFMKSFPDKSFAVSIIPNDAFPGIAESGSLITGAVGDENEPLLMSASQQLPGRFVVQFDFLMPGVAASTVVTNAAENYGTSAAFQTNEYLGNQGAGCSEPVTSSVPCTASTFLTLLETGIYPLGQSNPLRAQYIEVFHANASAFPATIQQAHLDLTCDYALSLNGQVFPASGGTGTINISTGSGCPWVVGTLPVGSTITSATNGTGPGSVTFQVSPSFGGDLSNSFTIAEQTFTIEQQALSIPGLSFIGSMPHLAAEGGWNTTFMFVNKSTAPAVARTSFFAPTGPALTLPIDLPQQPAISGPLLAASIDQTVAPNASLVMQTAGPANVNYLEGSAQLAATTAVDGFEIFHYDPTQQEAVVPLETRNAPSYLLPFDNTSNILTGVALGNVSGQAASIPVVVSNDAGVQIGTSTISLNAFGHTSFVLSQSQEYPQFSYTADIRGTVEFDTPLGGQISVLGIRYTPPGTLTTIPALASVTTGGLVAHIASGNGWRTTFVLVNIGASPAQAQLSFFDDNGNPLPLPLTFPQSSTGPTTASVYAPTIASGASRWIQTEGPLPTLLLTGSAQLSANANIQGFVIFHYDPNGQEAVVPLESRNASAYLVAFDNTNGTATGIAVSDVSSQPLNLSVILRDDTGAILPGPSFLPLAANGHYSQLLTTLFPATAGRRGTVEFDTPAGAQISVLGIRSPPALTFTTLPPLAK